MNAFHASVSGAVHFNEPLAKLRERKEHSFTSLDELDNTAAMDRSQTVGYP